jgi:Fe-S cluster assembly ATPase SufC
MLRRAVNVGYSGGQKNITKFADGDPAAAAGCAHRTDSGINVDTQIVAGVNRLRSQTLDDSYHYQRLLSFIVPTWCTFWQGRVMVKSGGGLALRQARAMRNMPMGGVRP